MAGLCDTAGIGVRTCESGDFGMGDMPDTSDTAGIDWRTADVGHTGAGS